MKILKIFGIAATITLVFGCSKSFLNDYPKGGAVSEEQFNENPESFEAMVKGLYSLMITGGTSSHSDFGQKSIDLKTDMISGDIALIRCTYGWFESVERLQEYNRSGLTSYIWSYYYAIIKNANLIIRDTAGVINPQTANDTIKSYYVGQAYAMRGYAYSALTYYYAKWPKAINVDENLAPVYLENTPDVAQDVQSLSNIFSIAENDFVTAKQYIARYEATKNYVRLSKVEINTDVVSLMLAYLYIHKAQNLIHPESDNYDKESDLNAAIALCDEVINSGNYPMLSYDKLLATGFNSVTQSDNWMWGIDIDAETTGMLASFWGAVDVYTYSYAYSGDIKAIDQNLWNSMPESDKRKQWFTSKEKLAPVNKFFDRAKIKGGDRNWLNDLVFMRVEEAYLIAAEAAFLKSDFSASTSYLHTLLLERDKDVAATITSVTDEEQLKKQIIYNWRTEMWGEGRAYFTMRRFCDVYFKTTYCSANTDQNYHRGDNHLFEKTIPAGDFGRLCFVIPYAEMIYNPYISGQSEFQHE
ncbi:MAG: RagB/SusD family nutrient uptake outer membrane protein [Prevotellaceae bacterium]|jgi:hypothetical protein|nr:RagB/SusD family nutrient uptake outer membrane protein [Prevotellaceae bacterium]